MKEETLVDVLCRHAAEKPDHCCATWVDSKCRVAEKLTYRDIWNQAGAVADLLRHHKVVPGDRVMVAYPPGISFMAGFFGCLRAGVIACSVYPPNPAKNAKHSFDQFNTQVADADAKFALTSTPFKMRMLAASVEGKKTKVKWLTTDKLRVKRKDPVDETAVCSAALTDIAFIQYSSGSTSKPKGIMISHRAIMSNLECITGAVPYTEESVTVSWMPQYHDFALIAGFLLSIYSVNSPMVACSPVDFIKNPILWVDMLEKFQGTHTAGPNFAYGLLAKRMKTSKRAKLKAPLMRACIAAEPIAPETLELMKDVIGIPAEKIAPCYGMAECVVYTTDIVGDEVFVMDGVVSVGLIERSLKVDIRFVIAESDSKKVLTDGDEGEIFVSTPSVASGYWGQPVQSEATFCALTIDGRNFLSTGDMGMILDGRLYVTSRRKELIIVNGRNVYPTDLERSLEKEFPTIIRPGATVAHQSTPTSVGIVLEIRDSALPKFSESALTVDVVRSHMREAHDVVVDCVYFLKQGSVPKTTSGKLRRVETKERSLGNDWPPKMVVPAPVSRIEADPRALGKAFEVSAQDAHAKPSFDTIVARFFGDGFDEAKTWDQQGLTSMTSVELRDALEQTFGLLLSPECFEKYPTPAALKEHVKNSSGVPLKVDLPALSRYESNPMLSWQVMAILQAVGSAMLLLLFSVSIIPAWHIWQWLLTDDTDKVFQLEDGRWMRWMWLPFSVPTFMLSFSFSVVIAKWIVVGRYREGEIPVRSFAYLRWWWVDRAVHMWEFWAGNYMRDTIFLWMFYRLFGANIHYTVKMDAFIREFDLVNVGEHTRIQHQMRCKRFGSWGDDGPVLRFRATTIGKNCKVQGILGPGAVVGEHSCVERCSAVPEGGIVPAYTLARGKLAFNAGPNTNKFSQSFSWMLEGLKALWYGVELYNFFTLILVAQLLYWDRLPADWRYTRLCYWFLYIATAATLAVAETIPLKWILIGRRKPGQYQPNSVTRAALWAVDFHFKATAPVLLSLSTYSSVVWNTILRLMGMDIDYSSKVPAICFPPSVVDLVSVKNSFVSTSSFDVEKDGCLQYTAIKDSSIGYNVHVGAGISLSRKIIPPVTFVQGSASQEKLDPRSSVLSADDETRLEVTVLALYIMMVGVVAVSLVPAYELWMEVFQPDTVYTAVPVMALALAVQTCVWLFVLKIFQYAALGTSRRIRSGKPWALYMVYQSNAWAMQSWSFLSSIHGTPLFNAVARFLGVSFEGQAIYLGLKIYEWSLVTFSDKTVVDDAFLSGHFAVYEEMTVGPARISGIVHEGTMVSVGADIDTNETGPLRVCFHVSNDGTDGEDSVSSPDTMPHDNIDLEEGVLRNNHSDEDGSEVFA